MNAPRRLLSICVASALLMAAFALAQAPTESTGAGVTVQASEVASLDSLRLQANRLAFLNDLPEASRAEATALLERADELRSRAMDLQRTTLEAYVTALEQGDDRTVARAAADATVGAARLTLSQDQALLRVDVNAFLSAHPELKGTPNALLGTAPGGRPGMGRGDNGHAGRMQNRSAPGMKPGDHHARGRSQKAPSNLGRGMGQGRRQPGTHPRSGTATEQGPGTDR